MKKFIVAFLIITVLLSFSGCGEKKPAESGEEAESTESSVIDNSDISKEPGNFISAGLWGDIIGENPQPKLDLKPGSGAYENGSPDYTFNLNGYYITSDGIAKTTNNKLAIQELADVRAVAHPTYRTSYSSYYYFLKNDNTLWGYSQTSGNVASELTKLLDGAACIYDLPSNDGSRRYVKAVTSDGKIYNIVDLEAKIYGDPSQYGENVPGYVSAPLHRSYFICNDGTLWSEGDFLIGNVIDVMTIDKETYILRGDNIMYQYTGSSLIVTLENVESMFNGYVLTKSGTLYNYNKYGTKISDDVRSYYWDGSYIKTDNTLVKIYTNINLEEIPNVVECWFGYDYNIVKALCYVTTDGKLHNWYDEEIASDVRVKQ